jgi:hypothetical protein
VRCTSGRVQHRSHVRVLYATVALCDNLVFAVAGEQRAVYATGASVMKWRTGAAPCKQGRLDIVRLYRATTHVAYVLSSTGTVEKCILKLLAGS